MALSNVDFDRTPMSAITPGATTDAAGSYGTRSALVLGLLGRGEHLARPPRGCRW